MADQALYFGREREIILASILKSHHDLYQLQCELHETLLRARETVSQSRQVIAKADEALARR